MRIELRMLRKDKRRRDAILGIAVTLSFVFLATTACIDDNPLVDAMIGTYAPRPPTGIVETGDVHDTVQVLEDGSMTFEHMTPDMDKVVVCDSRTGQGTSDKAAQDRMEARLQGRADRYKREVEAIDKYLKSCEGKPQSDDAIMAAHGCSEAEETRLDQRATEIHFEIEKLQASISKFELALAQNHIQIRRIIESGEDHPSRGNLKGFEKQNQSYRSEIAREKKSLADAKDRQAEIGPLLEKVTDNCKKARSARDKEPCLESSVKYHRKRRDEVVTAAAMYKSYTESFRNCVKRMAQSKKPAESGRPTVDPGTVIQMFPGLMGPRPSRPSRTPPPSAPSHSHSHGN